MPRALPLLALALVASPAQAQITLDYRLTWQPDGGRLDVALTLPQQRNEQFCFSQAGGVSAIDTSFPDGGSAPVKIVEGCTTLDPDVRGVHYVYPIDKQIADRGPDLFSGAGQGQSRIFSARLALLHPRFPWDHPVLIHLDGAKGHLPWEPSGENSWQVPERDLLEPGFHALNGEPCTVTVAGSTLEIDVLEGPLAVDRFAVCKWIETAAKEVLMVRKKFPAARASIIAVPVSTGEKPGEKSTDASPFGTVQASNPPSVGILVNGAATQSDFDQDWVAIHELLHLAHPEFQPEVPWLSEGLATYFTQVAKMRAGRFTEQQGWAAMVEGLQRGKAKAEGKTLEENTARMRQGYFAPVYWGGALVALQLDLAIRSATADKKSLDDVLESFSSKSVTLEAFGKAVDTVAGKPVFDAVLKKERTGPAVSHADEALKALGVATQKDQVVLKTGPKAALRKSISKRRAVE